MIGMVLEPCPVASKIPEATNTAPVGSIRKVPKGARGIETGAGDAKSSQDSPGGTVGRGQMSRQIRSLDQRRNAAEFGDLPLLTKNGDHLMRLGDIAKIETRTLIDQPYSMLNGSPLLLT